MLAMRTIAVSPLSNISASPTHTTIYYITISRSPLHYMQSKKPNNTNRSSSYALFLGSIFERISRPNGIGDSALEYYIFINFNHILIDISYNIYILNFQARTCPPNTIACNGSCLPGTLRCDGKRDCDNGIDEHDCPGNIF